MKTYILEVCGTELGVPGGPPDNEWGLLSHLAFKTEDEAEKFLKETYRTSSEWSHYRVNWVEVR